MKLNVASARKFTVRLALHLFRSATVIQDPYRAASRLCSSVSFPLLGFKESGIISSPFFETHTDIAVVEDESPDCGIISR